jgi:hypothetical protein
MRNDYVTLCTDLLSNETETKKCRMLSLWLLIGLGRLWIEYDQARWHAVRSVAYEKVKCFGSGGSGISFTKGVYLYF